MTTPTLFATVVDAPFGPLTVVVSDVGVRSVHWRGFEPPADVAVDPGHQTAAAAATQLAEYLHGDRTEFDLPLDLVGTAFQVKAWRALATIPFATTVSYAEQARRIGSPSAVRAIGAANGKNPVPLILPCHRVVGSNGALTGFAGGLEVKRWLLDHEARVAGGTLFG